MLSVRSLRTQPYPASALAAAVPHGAQCGALAACALWILVAPYLLHLAAYPSHLGSHLPPVL
jgi:hypothetical protein